MRDREPNANPYSPPSTEDAPPAELHADRDAKLRNEYLGAILLAAVSGLLASVMLLASRRPPASEVGEVAVVIAKYVSFVLAAVSLAFVGITFRAAGARIWLLIGRIRRGRR